MATLVENAVRIKQTFDDMYNAIVEKGVSPSGGVDTYSDAIDDIDNYIKASSAQYKEGILWYGGNAYVTSSSSLVQFVPSTYRNIGGQIGVRSSDNKSVTIQKAGIYLISTAICDQGYNSATTANANRGVILVRRNNVQIASSSIVNTPRIVVGTYLTFVTLNVGDVITLYIQHYAGSNRRIGGGASFMRLGDAT